MLDESALPEEGTSFSTSFFDGVVMDEPEKTPFEFDETLNLEVFEPRGLFSWRLLMLNYFCRGKGWTKNLFHDIFFMSCRSHTIRRQVTVYLGG